MNAQATIRDDLAVTRPVFIADANSTTAGATASLYQVTPGNKSALATAFQFWVGSSMSLQTYTALGEMVFVPANSETNSEIALLEMFAPPSVRRKLAALRRMTGLLSRATDDQVRLFEEGSRRRPLLSERE